VTRHGDCLVLLHGLGRTRWSMAVPALRFRAKGYRVVNVGYPSRRFPIEALARQVGEAIAARATASGRRVHFLTHSMGGIVLRRYLAEDRPDQLGRVVMLSPPNQGSLLARKLQTNPFFRAATGPSGQQLGVTDNGVVSRLGPVDYELGVITGSRSGSQALAFLLPGESDGKVTIDEAKVDGMTDFLVVPRAHTFIMNSSEVITQAAYFFRHGRFRRENG